MLTLTRKLNYIWNTILHRIDCVVISVKDGVAFVTGYIRNGLRTRTAILGANPLLFVELRRIPTQEEIEATCELVAFFEKAFKDNRSEEEIIMLLELIKEYTITHEQFLYVIHYGIRYHILDNVNVIPDALRYQAQVLGRLYEQDVQTRLLNTSSTSSSNSDSNSDSSSDSSSDIIDAIAQFLAGHTLIIIGAIGVVCVAVVAYIFRPKGPSGTTSPSSTDTTKSSKVSSFITSIVFSSSVKYIVTIYASWILFVRSFFLKERPWFIPIVMLIAHLNLYFRILPLYDYTDITKLFLWLGIYLIAVDNLGSLISTYALSNTPNLFDQVIPFLKQKRSKILEHYYCGPGIFAIIIGKTPMTATGRAALGVGVMSGAAVLLNAHFERQHQAAENQRHREYKSAENQRHRDWQDQRDQRNQDREDQRARANQDREDQRAQKNREWEAYKSSWNPFKKPPK